MTLLGGALTTVVTAPLSPSASIAAPATASPTATPSTTASPTPDYPVPTPSDDTVNLDEGERVAPSITTRTEHLDLAIIDKLHGEIDTAALVAAVGKLDVGDRRILVAVDREPAGSPHARSLAGSMLFFVHPDVMRDDWLGLPEGSKRVAQDWLLLSVILPEAPGQGSADVFFQEGTNVRLDGTDTEVVDAISAAGAALFDRGDYTSGLEQMIATAVERTEIKPDLRPWGLGILGALVILGLAFWAWHKGAAGRAHRAKVRTALGSGADLTDLLGPLTLGQIGRLRQVAANPHSVLPPVEIPDDAPHPSGPVTTGTGEGDKGAGVRARVAAQLSELDNVLDRVTREVGTRRQNDQQDQAMADRLAQVQAAYDRTGTVLTHGVSADPTWVRGAVEAQRTRLEWITQALTAPGARQLPVENDALKVIVDQTLELDGLRQDLQHVQKGPKGKRTPESGNWWGRLRQQLRVDDGNDTGVRGDEATPPDATVTPGVAAEQLLDRMQQLREESMAMLTELQRQLGRTKLPQEVADMLQPVGYGPGQRDPLEGDPLEQLDAADQLRGLDARGTGRGWRAWTQRSRTARTGSTASTPGSDAADRQTP